MPSSREGEPGRRLVLAVLIGAPILGIVLAALLFFYLTNDDDGSSQATAQPTAPAAAASPTAPPPPAGSNLTPEAALAETFELGPNDSVVDCGVAEMDDTLCYIPYMTNIADGRYLFHVGIPFSEFTSWALVERGEDGAFTTTRTAPFELEGDGSPPFEIEGEMAGVFFTSATEDEIALDRLDTRNNPLPAGAPEIITYIRYTGLNPFDTASVVIRLNGAAVSEPSRLQIHGSGEGTGTIVLGGSDGETVFPGAYEATVIVQGREFARAEATVLAQ